MKMEVWGAGIGQHLVKIKNGKNVVGNFRGSIVRFYQHWSGGQSMKCPGRDTCPLCASDDPKLKKASGRFRMNFVTKEDGKLVARIFEGSRRVYQQLEEINKDLPLEKAWVKVARSGTGTDTQYFITVPPGDGGMLRPDDEKAIMAVKLLPLDQDLVEKEEESASAG